mmetsp:Transcript_14820/g.35167  ORF Transcript_14820/g.35167 Transcript_14820/m.35167 type:complete len:1205 (-) Transcript_14820:500-4114(-)
MALPSFNYSFFLLVLFFSLGPLPNAGYQLQGSLTWERVGALPHFIAKDGGAEDVYNGACGKNTPAYRSNSNCGKLSNAVPENTLTTDPNEQIRVVHLVLDLVLDRDIIEQTTSAGSLLISLGRRLVQGDAVQLGYFCTDTQQVGCTPGDGCACEYPTHTVMHVDDDNGLVYTRYTKIVSYSVGFASVRAGYNHTLDGGYYVNCFDPTVGTNQDADGNVIKDPCYCMTKECNIGVEAGYRYPEWTLLTTVNFIAASQPFLNGVTPNTNHHAPRLDFVPVVYVPWLLTDQNATFLLSGVDEDGETQVVWEVDGSDTVLSVTPSGELSIAPMTAIKSTVATYHYFIRLKATDPVEQPGNPTALVSSYIQFWVSPCARGAAEPVPVFQVPNGVRIDSVGVIAPVYVHNRGPTCAIGGVISVHQDSTSCANAGGAWHARWFTEPARTVTCYVKQACNVTVSAVLLDMTANTFCRWNDASVVGTLCSDLVRSGEVLDFQTGQIEATGEHLVSVTEGNPAAVDILAFQGRADRGMELPYEYDIGRKEVACFQSKASSMDCPSLPHCVTFVVKGSIPQVVLPDAPLECPTSPTPDPSAYLNNECPDLYLCWQSSTVSQLTFDAFDEDAGETLNIQIDSVTTLDNNNSRTEGYSMNLIDLSALHFPGRVLPTPAGYCQERTLDPYATSRAVRSWAPASIQATCNAAMMTITVDLDFAPTSRSPLLVAENALGQRYVEFGGDRLVCFTVSDNQPLVWGRGLVNSYSRCHVVRLRGPPIFISGPETLTSDTPFASFDSQGLAVNPTTLLARIATPIEFTFRARDPNPEDRVTILFLTDPGLPNGAVLTEQQCVDSGVVSNIQSNGIPVTFERCPAGSDTLCPTISSACREAFRKVRWSPMEGEEGLVFEVCAVARDDRGVCATAHYRQNPGCNAATLVNEGPPCTLPSVLGASDRSVDGGFYGPEHCVKIQVVSPMPVWDPESVPTEAGAERLGHVGCQVRWMVAAEEQNNYTMRVELVDGYSLPDGAVLEDIQEGSRTQKDVVWTPVRGQEGSEFTTCFRAYAVVPGGSGDAMKQEDGRYELTHRCVTVRVRRCKYCVGPEDTLLVKMKELTLDMNWLRLWAANGNEDGDDLTSTIEDPGLLTTGLLDGVQNGQVVNIGPVYKLQNGESLMQVAARFRTTVRSLLELNPDIADENTVQVGQELCLIPCTTSMPV